MGIPKIYKKSSKVSLKLFFICTLSGLLIGFFGPDKDIRLLAMQYGVFCSFMLIMLLLHKINAVLQIKVLELKTGDLKNGS